MNRTSAPAAPWQFPWLRVSLIIRRLETAPVLASLDDSADDLASLLDLRQTIERAGWFN